MDLDKAMLEQIADEEKARDVYFDMAKEADEAGMYQTARNLRSIAADEARHHMVLQQMYQSPELGPMRELPADEIRLSGRMVEYKIGEEPTEGHYWEVTNMATGEILQSGKRYELIGYAVRDAKKELRRGYQHYGDDHLVIKVFDKSPDERAGLTLEPEYSESFWVKPEAGPPRPPSRPFPQSYGDWVSLGMDIKEKDPTVGTAAWVNMALQHIADNDEDAEQSKRWLVDKAGELGIK